MSNITVTKVGVLSIGKLLGIVNLIVGLAIILSAVVLYPLVMFAFGWLYGVLVAFIFNVFVGVSGGVELTVKNDSSKK